ncbi:BREX-1 system adenine-specific DNA-methyltransferase PglX, partial [Lacticaseibacillus rhamnosus]
YWASKPLISDFEIGIPLKDLVDPKVGLQTGDNSRFLRQWFEVNVHNISFNTKSTAESLRSIKKWFPYNKGGSYRKWYGNFDYIVNWQHDGFEIKHFTFANGKQRSVIRNSNYYFREAITWSDVTSGHFSMRYRESGSIFDVVGMSLFSLKRDILEKILAFSNTKVMNFIMSLLNPTIHASIGYVSLMPIISSQDPRVNSLSKESVDVTRNDWDTFENSWNFSKSPLVEYIAEHHRNWTIEAAFNQWKEEADKRFNQLKANEEELNRIFIDLYGLQDELSPEEEDKDVSVRRADLSRDIKAFMSYFVGCVFGRYSIDTPGLAYAGGDWDDSNYKTFLPNEDDVIVLTDDDYFGDNRDVVNRFKEFLSATFGTEHLDENVQFIADALGKRGSSSEEIIRAYLRDDFFKKDHLSTYQKRPIYWELNSGRNGGFKALMYLHRYDKNTMAMIRTKYLHPLQEAYERRLDQLKSFEANEQQTRQKNAIKKQITTITKQLDELVKYDEKLQHVANLHIDLDLDDGVLVNHAKAQADTKIFTPLK